MHDLSQIKGIIPALVTPFDELGNFDEFRLRAIINELITEGVGGLYLTGSTGECFTMTAAERNRVIEITVDEVNGRVPLIAHVGDIGTKKSIDLAKTAESLGVDAISSVPPFYWKFTEAEIYGYYKELSLATSLPFIIYNIPLAGLMGLSLIKRIAQLQNVVGIKYTAATHYEIALLKADLGEHFKVYSGLDEMAISGLLYGADGVIGSFYNLMPELYIKIFQAHQQGNYKDAILWQKQATQIIALALRYSYVSVIKMAMGWKGTGGGFCRKPFENNYDIEEQIKAEYRELRNKFNIQGVKFLDAI